MANFNIAVVATLLHEGGYVDNPNDKGGPTKYGITQADMPGVVIADITAAQAAAYYKEHYWKPLYGQMSSQDLCNKLFDMGVLAGVGTAVKCLQRALGLERADVDGIFGSHTLLMCNLADTTGAVEHVILPAFLHVLDTHFEAVVATSPQDAEFLKGWENRVAA